MAFDHGTTSSDETDQYDKLDQELMRAPIKHLSARMPVLIVLTVLLLAIGSHILTLPDKIALGGVSPIAWINHLTLPGNFVRDFPDGTDNYKLSLYMHAYPALHACTGLSTEKLIELAIYAEIFAKAFAVWFLCRTLMPSTSTILPAISVLIVLVSSLGMADLSRISTKPYFPGLYYSAADAARLIGIGLVVRRRWVWASIFLAFSAASHPIMGLMGACFAAVAVLTSSRDALREARLWQAAGIYILLVGTWYLISFGFMGKTASQQVPVDIWVAYTTSFNMHWYPYAFGALTEFHGQHLLPLLTFIALFFHYLPRVSLRSDLERAWRWGMAALSLMTIFGVAFSTWAPLPFLVKLNLLRASELALWLGLPVILAGLLHELVLGAWWRRPIAGALILSPFLSEAVLPTIGAALLTAGPTLSALRGWRTATASVRSACIVFLAVALLLGWYLLFSGYMQGNTGYYLGGPRAWMGGVLLAALIGVVVRTWDNHHGELFALIFVAMAAGLWLTGDFHARQRNHERAVAYRAVQDWARVHTPHDALFAVDPLFLYGWRDYSQRSSFGNVREWLHTSWLYDSNPTYYREGMKRFAELGIDASPYLALRPTNVKMSTFYAAVQQRFYVLDDAWRLDLARRHGIDYFVMDRNLPNNSTLPHAYENAQYIVLAVPPAQP